jgi:hypothetical protein
MATRTRPKPGPAAAAGMLQLSIELRHFRPRIWRRVLVPETLTLQQLHQIIQIAFDWGGGHLHEFNAAGVRYGTADPDFDPPGSVGNERTRLTRALTPAGTIDYVYDFGDYWEHRIKVEKTLPATGVKLPVCIAGANAAPPDDCGGPPGYADFVQAMADPGHPEHASMKEWYGDEWDPHAFDIDRINARLGAIGMR